MKSSKFVFGACLFFVMASLLPAQNAENAVYDGEIVFSASALSDEETSFFGGWTGEWNERKHPFVALTGALGFNVLLATWNRYMIGSNWAKTGWDEWNHFWEREMSWDRDWYWTNFFLHPYQGSMYYMASRGSNLNQLESFLITALGSYIWEYLCETNAPSKNDMVFTSVGSFAVGEMFYRLSIEAEEINSLLKIAINPQRLWTEYLWGIKPKRTGGHIHSLSLGVDIGNVNAGVHLKDKKYEYPEHETFPLFGMVEFKVEYNDPYRHDSNRPYDQFTLEVQGGIGKGSGKGSYCAYEDVDEKLFYDIRILSDGMFFARELDLGQNVDTSVGAVMLYDFDWQSLYVFSSLAPGFAFKQRFNGEDRAFEWQAMLAGILLGNTDFYYYQRKVIPEPDGVSCGYNDTVGFESVLKLKYATENGFACGLDFRGYAMYDFKNQLQSFCSTGWEFFGLLSASVEVPVSKKVRIGVRDELFGKFTRYNDTDTAGDLRYIVNTARVFAKLQLK
mgnify:FL=1